MNNDISVTNETFWKWCRRATQSPANIIGKSVYEWSKLVIHAKACILYFVRTILCFKQKNPMKTNTSYFFHSCYQGRSILTRYCGEREAGIVIFVDYSNTLELVQGWYQFISLPKINLAPPNIHSECKKCLCSCVHHVCFLCVWGIVWYW